MDIELLKSPIFWVGEHYVSTLGAIAFGALFVGGLILAKVFQTTFVRRLFTWLKLDVNLVAIVTTILSLATIVFFTITAVNAAGIPLPWSTPLPGVTLSLIQILLLIALLVAVFWISSHTKRFLFTRVLKDSGLDRSLQYAIAQISSKVVLVVGILVVLTNTGINLSALAVFAGAIGVGVGVGLQGIASNFISGVIILAERPITIGDRVEVGKVAGQVERIRARCTIIRTNDNISMIIPNKKFIEDPVTNWTYGDPRVRFRIPVGVAYGSDLERVKDALIAAGAEHPAALKDPAPSVFLDKFGDSSIDFELVVWSDEMSYRPRRFRSDLNFAIARRFKEAGIEIPNPQRDVYIKTGDIRVRTEAAEEEQFQSRNSQS
ncbi:MAG: mechanosensitive ion channel family protein [Chthoniobacterales bacterium]